MDYEENYIKRKKLVGKSQRDKGKRGERSVVNMFKASGFDDAKRNLNDVVDGQGVDVTAGNFRIQVKRYGRSVPMNKLYEIESDGTSIELLCSKVDHEPWLATLRLSDLLAILEDVGVAYDYDAPPF